MTGSLSDVAPLVTATPFLKYFIKNEGGNYSILNSNFETISSQDYHFLEYAYDKYFIATNQQDKVGVIDIDGNIVVEC